MHLPFAVIIIYSFIYAKLIFEGFLFVSFLFLHFPNICTTAGDKVAVAGNFPPHCERKRIGRNKPLLSIWLTCHTALKRDHLFLCSEARGETHEQIAVTGATSPVDSYQKSSWQCRPHFTCWDTETDGLCLLGASVCINSICLWLLR